MTAPVGMEKNAFGMDKIKNYGWTVTDSLGELRMISKHDLVVDHEYQRNASSGRVLAMAKEWSWVACGAFSVADRGGRLFVVDGQHRYLAAMRRSDIDMLPCVVFHSQSVAAEAKAFVEANTNRRPMHSAEKFRAQLIAGDVDAMTVYWLAKQSGRDITTESGPKTVRCVGALLKCAKTDSQKLKRIWPVIADVCQGHPLHARIVDAFWYVESNMRDGESIADRRWRDRLTSVGYHALLDGMTKFAAAYSRGGARVFAMGVMECVNKGLRNRLSLKTSPAEEAS